MHNQKGAVRNGVGALTWSNGVELYEDNSKADFLSQYTASEHHSDGTNKY